MTESKLNAALAACMAEIGVCERDRQMVGGAGYRYLSDDQIMARAQPILAAHGVTVAPAAMELLGTFTAGKMSGVRIVVTWRVQHASGEAQECATLGEAADSGDKAVNKAMTAARKYLFRLLFSIPTEEDPDSVRPETGERSVPAQPRRPSPPAQPRPPAPEPRTIAQGIRRDCAIAVKRDQPGALPATIAALEVAGDALLSRLASALEMDNPTASILELLGVE
jgi:hypothetical protein